ncbi:MAG: PspC domain-containing protein [Spirochaetaceae bacterium]|nr:PspC domain-containing protein [Spirochaetaceae bacterium]
MAQNRLYRSRNGMIFGVCQGIAEWRDLPVGYIRLGLIIALVFTGFFPIGLLYLAAGFFLPVEPKQGKSDYYDRSARGKREYRRESRREKSRGFSFDDIKEEFDDLASRVNRMEDDVIDKEKDWEQRFKDDK